MTAHLAPLVARATAFLADAPGGRLAAASMAAALLTGCFDPDPAVFVAASLTEPEATLQRGTLTSAVSGGFKLSLHLGPLASDPSEVSLGSFSLAAAEAGTTLLDTLQAWSATTFPVGVPVDSTVEATLTFDADDNLLDPDGVAAMCGAGPWVIRGVVVDSLRGGPISMQSSPFTPTGCP